MLEVLIATVTWTDADPAVVTSAQNCSASGGVGGNGTYVVTLSDGIDSAECIIRGHVNATANDENVTWTVAHTSDTVKTITTQIGDNTGGSVGNVSLSLAFYRATK